MIKREIEFSSVQIRQVFVNYVFTTFELCKLNKTEEYEKNNFYKPMVWSTQRRFLFLVEISGA